MSTTLPDASHDRFPLQVQAHERQPDRGEGWYLVCRPARPAPPIELERYLTAARPVADTDLVGRELTELREVERDLDVDDPRGDAYAEAIGLLEWQLRATAKEQCLVRRHKDYVPVADDTSPPTAARSWSSCCKHTR